MSSEPTEDQQLLKCLELLSENSTDEEKFVALLLLPRLLDDPQSNGRKLWLCFERMNWSFVERLLSAEDTPDMPQEALHSIAVNLIAGFAAEDDLVGRPELTTQIPCLAKLLIKETAETVGTVLQCLHRMAMSADSAAVILEEDTLRCIICVLSGQTEELSLQALRVLEQLYAQVSSSTTYMDRGTEEVSHQLLPEVARLFATNNGQLKFECARFLVEMSADQTVRKTNTMPSWALDVRQGVTTILRSKIGVEQRDMAFILSSSMLRQLGSKWMAVDSSKKQGDSGQLSETQFWTLLVHLAGGEIRVLLDDIPASEVPEANSRVSTILPVCAEIVELLMRGLIELSTDEAPTTMSTDVLSSIRESLHETFESVRSYLVDIYANFQYKKDRALVDNVVTAACLRLMSTWLAEEDSLAPKEIQQVIPIIVIAGTSRLECIGIHPIEFLGPALVNITADPQIRDAFLNAGGCGMIVNFWRNLNAISPLSLSIVSILLNIVATKGDTAVKAESNTFLEALALSLADMNRLRGQDPRSADMIVLAHYIAFSVMVIRNLTAAQVQSNEKIIAEIVDHAASFLLAGLETSRAGAVVDWADLKELWLISASGCAQSIPKGHPLRQLPSIQKLVADTQAAKLGLVEPEVRDSMTRLGKVFL
ncbi:hypothetical protein PhCBS80983_g02173 [Powellomyces hirtus]|uniref:Neurochondrin n=1 Tax=Powellomyces hirtus TaxID=109895 RepID=A0A507E747_9FUNG|nr:hypothetical protein PhCBS80983_g02173 [Powellomyces hirtus]